jgi:hypothetical protein
MLANSLKEFMNSEILAIDKFDVWCITRSASLKMTAHVKEKTLALEIARGQVEL